MCKVRYCGKFVSEVKINDAPVNKEWVEFPVGARLNLLATSSGKEVRESSRVESIRLLCSAFLRRVDNRRPTIIVCRYRRGLTPASACVLVKNCRASMLEPSPVWVSLFVQLFVL